MTTLLLLLALLLPGQIASPATPATPTPVSASHRDAFARELDLAVWFEVNVPPHYDHPAPSDWYDKFIDGAVRWVNEAKVTRLVVTTTPRGVQIGLFRQIQEDLAALGVNIPITPCLKPTDNFCTNEWPCHPYRAWANFPAWQATAGDACAAAEQTGSPEVILDLESLYNQGLWRGDMNPDPGTWRNALQPLANTDLIFGIYPGIGGENPDFRIFEQTRCATDMMVRNLPGAWIVDDGWYGRRTNVPGWAGPNFGAAVDIIAGSDPFDLKPMRWREVQSRLPLLLYPYRGPDPNRPRWTPQVYADSVMEHGHTKREWILYPGAAAIESDIEPWAVWAQAVGRGVELERGE